MMRGSDQREASAPEPGQAAWLAELTGAPVVLELAADLPRGSSPGERRQRAVARLASAVPEAALLAAFTAMLATWARQRDLLVGVDESLLRVRLDPAASFEELLAEIRRGLAAARERGVPDLTALASALAPAGDHGRQPLLQARLRRLEPHRPAAALDLDLAWTELPAGGVELVLVSRADLFLPSTGQRWLRQLMELLAGGIARPDALLGELLQPPRAERHQLLCEWQGGAAAETGGHLLHHAFEAHARRRPRAIAVEAGGQRLSYGELDLRSRALAARLAALGAGPDRVVGLFLARSADLVVGALAILRSGAAYLPLDSRYPLDRLRLMLEDAGAIGVVSSPTLAASLPAGPWWVDHGTAVASAFPPTASAEPGNLAYLIYTSGSTGRPKGVAVCHHNAVRFLAWAGEVFSDADLARTFAATSVCFDISVFELFMPLSRGGTVVLAPDALALGEPGYDDVSLVNTVPSAMAELCRRGALPASVRVVNLAGEPLTAALAAAVHQASARATLFNLYGPSEDTVYSTFARIPRQGDRAPAIGRPIAGTSGHVVDRDLRPLPMAVPGELVLGGHGLARGYLGRPALTAERFVPDPFGPPGSRLYRTGDLVRHRQDGELEFLGRMDHQVKLRGFRIELDEVKLAIERLAAVEEAVVVVDGAGPTARLVAYYVAAKVAAGPGLTGAELGHALRASLPEHMVPTVFVALPAMPRTPNGKLDRKALPKPALAGREREEPRTPLERRLLAIWSEVLELAEPPGLDDDFFALGGQSLLAARLATRVLEELGLELERGAVFTATTVRTLAESLETRRASGAWPAPVSEAPDPEAPDPEAPDPGPGELSPQQLQLWLFEQAHPGTAAYNVLEGFELVGPLEVPRLAAAFGELVARHAGLRSLVLARVEGPRLEVAPAAPVALPVIDLGGLAVAKLPPVVEALAAREGRLPIALDRSPLLRTLLLRVDRDRHHLLLRVHHAAVDGWSMDLIRRELERLWALPWPDHRRLPALALEIADFSRWQRGWLAGRAAEATREFWRVELAGLPPLALPADRPRPARPSFRGVRLARQGLLAAGETEALRRLAGESRASVFMVALATFQWLLHRWSGQVDLAVGVPAAQRDLRGLDQVVGYLVNLLVLRSRPRPDWTFRELLAATRRTTVGALAHQQLPFEPLLQAVGAERAADHNPLFQALFQLTDAVAPLRLGTLGGRSYERSNGSAKFELELSLEDDGREIVGALEAALDLFDATTARRLLAHYRGMLREVVAAPDRPLSAISGLAPAERQMVLIELADTRHRHGGGELVHELFSAAARRQPDAKAVVAGDRAISYGELDAASNRLARQLAGRGVGEDDLVALLVGRDHALPLAVLAALKAGAAYLPLDPAYPAERLRLMLELAKPKVLVCARALRSRLGPCAVPALVLEEMAAELAAQDAAPVPATGSPDSLAYVLFTSGSTGRPKGVAMPHRALANLVRWQLAQTGADGPRRVLQFAALSFDVAFQELFTTWAAGATLHLVAEEVRRDSALLLEQIERERVARLFLPYVALQSLAEAGARRPWPSALVEIVTAGEQPRLSGAVGAWLGRAPRLAFHNQYGPTESHVTSAWSWRQPVREAPERPPIGRPIANHQLYVVDRRGQAAGLGVPGELLIGGAGLARGYFGQPRQTAERFVPDAFATSPGQRVYLTGDHARVLPAGELEFLGRLDTQVKVRGFRIELGEVESALESHPAIHQAVAMVEAAGELGARLVAYVVPAAGAGLGELDGRAIEDHVAARLPPHLVPAAVFGLEALPRTPSGKLDRRALAGASRQEIGAARRPSSQGAAHELVLQAFAELFGEGFADAGPEPDFFALGGHSLLATRLALRLEERFGVACSVRTIFEHPGPAALARVLGAALAGRELLAERPLPRTELATPPLSQCQERFLALHELDPASGAYVLWDGQRFAAPVDFAALDGALVALVARHEPLRTYFLLAQEPRLQVVAAAPDRGPLAFVDLAALPAAAASVAERRLLRHAAARPFDPGRAEPRLRALAVLAHGGPWSLLLSFPHFAVDGESIGLLRRELATGYEDLLAGRRETSLPPLPVTYRDFAVWQRRDEDGAAERALAYWRQRLASRPAPLELPVDHPRTAIRSSAGRRLRHRLGPALETAVRELCRRRGTTRFMVVVTVLAELLRRLSGSRDLVVGVPVAGRSRLVLETLVGCFVSVLPVRLAASGETTASDQLGLVRRQLLLDLAHPELETERLAEELATAPSGARVGLFQVLAQVLEVGESGLALGTAQGSPIALDNGTSRFELEWTLTATAAGTEIWVEYRSGLFDATTIARWARAFETLTAGLCQRPERPLAELPWLTAAERHQAIAEWNDTAAALGRPACLHELFERQVDATPGAVAAASEEGELSYLELDAAANRLAGHLGELGVGAETLVAVALERSLDLIVALLAVLKAGGAYVPLDPTAPAERLAYLAGDARAPVVLTRKRFRERLAGLGGQGPAPIVLELDGLGAALAARSAARPRVAVDPAGAAYAIYTSGSTGRPKGVVNTHEGIVNRLLWMCAAYRLGADERVLQKTPVTFDVSVWELFLPLVLGARLVFARPEGHKDPGYLLELIEREAITTAHFVPSMLQLFLEEPIERASSLRRVVASGEALPAELERRFLARSGAALLNLYGPTEAAVEITAWRCRREQPRNPVPIGRPIANMGVRLVGQDGHEAPLGVPAELLLVGPGLARGYLGRPALTAERFVPDAAARVAGGRAYRTGDLTRWASDGTVEYLGRIDHQVKIRGFRIELGEIELVLAGHPAVREVAVADFEPKPGDRRLAAYVVAREVVAAEALREFLAAKLPDYMVPAAWSFLERLPLNANGKLDRKALPVPETALEPAAGRRQAPATPAEQLLAAIWCEVLGLESVAREDHFFALGGHSLLVIRLAARARGAFGCEAPLSELFTHETLAEQAAFFEARRRQAAGTTLEAALAPVARGERSPLSFAQERMLFLHESGASPWIYHVPAGLEIAGGLCHATLAASLEAVAGRHEVLRTALELADDTAVQRVLPATAVDLPVVDLGGLGPAGREAAARRLDQLEARRRFELAAGRPMRALLVRLGERRHQLLLTLHHSAADAWSLEILEQELWELYRARGQARQARLAELPIQYADFAAWQRAHFESGGLGRQLEYWRERLAGAPAALDLPVDRPRGVDPVARGGVVEFGLAGASVARLRALATAGRATLFMVLTAAFQLTLARLCGQLDVVVGAPITNRGRRELEGLIGLFVNAVALRTRLDGGASFAELLEQVRAHSLAAYDHQDLPFEKLVEALSPRRVQGRHPIFQVFLQLVAPPPPLVAPPALEVRRLARDADTAKFDLELLVSEIGAEKGGGLAGRLEFDRRLFDWTTARRFCDLLVAVVAEVGERPEAPLARLAPLAAGQRQQVLTEWNDTRASFDGATLPLHELIEAQVDRSPDAGAVSCGGARLSYRELDHEANRLAHWLRALGAGPETRVGVAMERSVELVVALLAVLKAGAAYVPLDPTHPEERLAYTLADARLRALLVQPRWQPLFERLVPGGGEPAVVALGEAATLDLWPSSRLPRCTWPETAAYAIYTSGSTGRPKGTVNSHAGIVNRLLWMQAAYGLAPDDRVLQKTPFTFDVSVWELFWPLLVGAELVLARPDGHKDPDYLLRLIVEERITTLHFVPSMLQLWVEQPIEKATSLRRVFASGEALPAELERRFLARSQAELHNLYGPTEAAVDVTFWPCRPGASRTPVPIGRPIANLGLRILDRWGQLVPMGVAGELLLTGAGLGRGYLGRPGLTAERFVPDGGGEAPGARAYRTGDLARYGVDGTVDFLGRIDHQVKIRGFRIELGEIESELGRHPAIREVVVTAWSPEAGDPRLIAYLVARSEVAVETLRAFLQRRVPEFMIPAHYVYLEQLPLNSNGKVDRKALPPPELDRLHLSRRHVPPRTETEAELVAIWRELVGLEQVGVHDDFFDLGGHSLLAIHVVTRVRNRWAVDLPVAVLFHESTVEKLAKLIDGAKGARPSMLVPMGGQGLPKEPFFCVHGIGGNVFRLVHLARRVGSHRPFYGIQGWADLEDTAHLGNVPAMAERYVAEIEAVQPQGPVYVGGYSLGSLVAYEMARVFASKGRPVAFVGLLDTGAPETSVSLAEAAASAEDESFEGGIALQLGIPIDVDHLLSLTPQERLVYVLEEGQRCGALPAGFGFADAFRFIDVYQRTAAANYTYGPVAYSGAVTLFATPANPPGDPTLGWGGLAAGGVEVVPISGDHFSMVFPPDVEVLAEALVAAMERAARRVAAVTVGSAAG